MSTNLPFPNWTWYLRIIRLSSSSIPGAYGYAYLDSLDTFFPFYFIILLLLSFFLLSDFFFSWFSRCLTWTSFSFWLFGLGLARRNFSSRRTSASLIILLLVGNVLNNYLNWFRKPMLNLLQTYQSMSGLFLLISFAKGPGHLFNDAMFAIISL